MKIVVNDQIHLSEFRPSDKCAIVALLNDRDIYNLTLRIIGSRADGGTVGYYLGHSPKSIQDKHYKAPDRDQFDEIITWLGQQFKLVK